MEANKIFFCKVWVWIGIKLDWKPCGDNGFSEHCYERFNISN